MKEEKFLSKSGFYVFDKIEKHDDIHNFDSLPNAFFNILEKNTGKTVAVCNMQQKVILFNPEFRFTIEQVFDMINTIK